MPGNHLIVAVAIVADVQHLAQPWSSPEDQISDHDLKIKSLFLREMLMRFSDNISVSQFLSFLQFRL